MKYIIILGDGMSDYPVARLGGKTPLQVARKPNMDRIAREGRCGLFKTIEEDMPTGSEAANLSVMGYDPRQVLQGRGVLEAASMGVDIRDDDMAMRCNLICLFDDGRIKNHSAGHISSAESGEILRTLQKKIGGPGLNFYTGVSYRHLFVGKGHPNEPAEGLLIRAKVPEAQPTADLLNSLIRRSWPILKDHPVNQSRRAAGKDPGNSIWLWSPGKRPKMWTFQERFGVSGAVISAVDLIRGIGVYAGLEADACLAALEHGDFCYVHVEAPDEAGHEGNLDLKIRTIEDLDARLIGRILTGLEQRKVEAVVAVLPDHPTPVEKRIHVRDAVPFAIRGPSQAPDKVERYDERSCAAGGFGVVHGDEFIRAVFQK